METLTASITPQVINHYALLCETIQLYPIENEHDYEIAISVLNNLLDWAEQMKITHWRGW